ncbi:MAG TPA: hypothetical protein VKE92_12940, partial [Anaerolineales bacterium]|nr:hypothetical protein [Anaerolineales bacterium]
MKNRAISVSLPVTIPILLHKLYGKSTFFKKTAELLKVKSSVIHPVLHQKYRFFNEVAHFSFCLGE